jgi:hypothetical protein
MSNETQKHWSEMKFSELNHSALIGHAKSLGGQKAVEAIKYLQELNEQVSVTPEMKEQERERLSKLHKRVKDKASGKFSNTDVPRHTPQEIEEKLNGMGFIKVHQFLEQKQMYCQKYYPQILPQKQGKGISYDDELAAALAELEAGSGKK